MNKQEEILMVAEYMGGREYVYKTYYLHYMQVEAELIDGTDLHFHDDYNWLIPVVKKVMKYLQDNRDKDVVYGRTATLLSNLSYILLQLEIELLWDAVVEAIMVINNREHADK